MCVCGGEVYNDLDVGSHIEKRQRVWTMMLRWVCVCGVCVGVCVCVCGRGEVYSDLDVGSHNEKHRW